MKERIWYSLYDKLLDYQFLKDAFRKVKSANGAPGIDGQSCKDFAFVLDKEILSLLKELSEKTYSPRPVKRVEIPKPDGGIRNIGIPTVRDRVVQQALKNILEPIFNPWFHPSNYGYRPNMGAHNAIAKATAFMRTYGLNWVVDMDLSKCFDTLDHDLIIHAVRARVADGSILRLIRMFLESGVMLSGKLEPTFVGSPQGGVISPLLANIYLDNFDQFMKSRGHRIVRYADDIVIFKASKSGADNALKTASDHLEKQLKLTVNQKKTHITSLSRGVSYLGVVIGPQCIRIQSKRLRTFKKKVKACTQRNVPVNMKKILKDLNPLLRGFANYFKVANCTKVFGGLMAWVRRRLRAIQMSLWKKPRKLHRRLRQMGYKGEFKCIKMASWRNAACQYSHWAMSNLWFAGLGLYGMDKVKTGELPPINRG
ncbi:MAG: group II intron reverse transcriptase/maturase [Proteobacteria bacterium]|nr:group II intron reverse transcriptase/maturase [Pseudomonadota bacterium]